MSKSELLSPYFLGIFGISLIVGIVLASESLPYIYHPDEPVLLKQPFKRLIQYKAGDFSSAFSLYDLLLVLWLGLTYLVGYTLGIYSGITHFGEEIILESASVVFAARMLSVFLVSLAHGCLFFFLKRQKISPFQAFLFNLLFLFNPILLAFAYKIKFEAIVYFFSIFLLSKTYDYFQTKTQRNKVYFWIIISLAVRIELIIFFFLAIIIDLNSGFFKRPLSELFTAKFIRSISLGILIYCLITLHPITFLYSFYPERAGLNLVSEHTFLGNILTGLINTFKKGQISIQIKENWHFLYPILISIFFIPILTSLVSTSKRTIVWIVHPLGVFLFLMVKSAIYHRYLLPLSTGLLSFLLVNYLQAQKNKKYILIGTVLCLFSFVLLSTQLLVLRLIHTDPRTLAKEFILTCTDQDDLLAIETISGAGSFPPIRECDDQMIAKSQYAKQFLPYAGTRYRLLIERKINYPCRRILDICELNYLESNPTSNNQFINTKDTAHFKKLDPKYFISKYSFNHLESIYPNYKSFYQHLKKYFVLIKVFPKHITYFDPRMKLINTRHSIYVYKKV